MEIYWRKDDNKMYRTMTSIVAGREQCSASATFWTNLISPCCPLVHYLPSMDIVSEADQHKKSTRDGQDGQGIEDQQ